MLRKGIRDGCFGQSLPLAGKFSPGAANGFHGIEISLPEKGEYSLTAADSFLSHPFSLRSTPSPSGEGRGEGSARGSELPFKKHLRRGSIDRSTELIPMIGPISP